MGGQYDNDITGSSQITDNSVVCCLLFVQQFVLTNYKETFHITSHLRDAKPPVAGGSHTHMDSNVEIISKPWCRHDD